MSQANELHRGKRTRYLSETYFLFSASGGEFSPEILKDNGNNNDNWEVLKKKQLLIYLMNECERLLSREITNRICLNNGKSMALKLKNDTLGIKRYKFVEIKTFTI